VLLTSSDVVRARLEEDRIWSAFSLADLDPPYAAHARWFGSAAESGIVLLYDAFEPPLLVLHGGSDGCAEALDGLARDGALTNAYLTTPISLLPIVERRFQSFEKRLMIRMRSSGGLMPHGGQASGSAIRLSGADLAAVEALYREEPPAFFLPMLLEQGVYFGVRDAGELVAIAGTHVVSARASVAAIGNVYTRVKCRGRGLATLVTRAVTDELRRIGIATIVLNVVASNDAARRIYERLGFEEYCRFYEGLVRPGMTV
jgi:GNAT superfamily N-acetyltransferase